jgi:hypothetical protein
MIFKFRIFHSHNAPAPGNNRVFKTSTGETNVLSKSIAVDETYSIGSQEFWCRSGAPVSSSFMGAYSFPPQCEDVVVLASWAFNGAKYTYTLKINSSATVTSIDTKFISFFACQ